MPLSELAELVARIDGVDLSSSEVRGAIIQRLGELQHMLDRIGATNSAAQLGVAAHLLQHDGGASSYEDVKRMARTLVVAVEQSFHLQPALPSASPPAEPAPVREAPQKKAKESRQAKKKREVELSVVRDMLLGEILVHFGVLTPEEICAALELQRDTDLRLGDVLVDYCFTSRDEVERALDYQNTIRGMLVGERKAPAPPEAVEEKPHAPRAAFRSLGRLRMATELLMGEVLILNGTITRKELERALVLQRTNGILIGEALIQLGAANRADIQRALVAQGRGDRLAKKTRSKRSS